MYKDLERAHVLSIAARHSLATRQKKRGVKVNYRFEAEVWSELLVVEIATAGEGESSPPTSDRQEAKRPRYSSNPIKKEAKQAVEAAPEGSKVVIRANVCYRYSVVRDALKEVQARPAWQEDLKVQLLTFSGKYIYNFLSRNRMSRRRTTTEHKKRPTVEEIVQSMTRNQDEIIRCAAEISREAGWNLEGAMDLLLDLIVNTDETGVNYAMGSRSMYIPIYCKRTKEQVQNVKARITAALSCPARGKLLPAFLIMKQSKTSRERPDQSTMTVIDSLHNSKDFTEEDGWKLKVWSMKIPTITAQGRDKGKIDPSGDPDVEHKVKYLIHRDGHIITSQAKAWNDQVRFLMYADLICRPHIERVGGAQERAHVSVARQLPTARHRNSVGSLCEVECQAPILSQEYDRCVASSRSCSEQDSEGLHSAEESGHY